MSKRSKKLSFPATISVFLLVLFLTACSNPAGPGSENQSFLVNFEANGGFPVPGEQLIQKGGLVVEPDPMLKSGYSAYSWFKDEDCKELWDFEKDIVIEDITLYAQWYSSAGGGGGGGGGSSSAGVKDLSISVTGPSKVLSPIDTVTLTIAVSGFTNSADANSVGLTINTIPGLSFSGHNAIGNAVGATKTFNVTFSYNGITPFAGAAAIIEITGLSIVPSGYAYSTGTKTEGITVSDGFEDYSGVGVDRRIPVTQGNVFAFNSYANTTDGLSRHYKLTENVDLDPLSTGANNWTAIGKYLIYFTGSFDGQDHTISNLIINTSDDTQGLFGYIFGASCIVKNLGLLNVDITGGQIVGGLVGFFIGSTVQKCHVTGIISGDRNVGGLVGTNAGYLQDCYFSGSVNSDNHVGGVVGNNVGATGVVKTCYATGNVSGDKDIIGGVVGYNEAATVQRCYFSGNVSGDSYVGGVVGNSNGSIIQNCYATGSVSGTGFLGGVVGWNSGITQNCFSTNSVSGDDTVGGIGFNMSTIQNCVAMNPSVTAASSTNYVGRVSGMVIGTGLLKNYARSSGMTLTSNGSPVSITSDPDGMHGGDIGAAQYHTASWWTTLGTTWESAYGAGAWDTAVWNISDGSLPTLKDMPPGVQNPVVP